MQRFTQLSELSVTAICGGFAAVCGALSYFLKVEEGHPFKWSEFLLHTAISAVCGLMAYELLSYWGMPPKVAGALCGMAGWMGTRLLRILEIAIRKRAGVTKEELEGDKNANSRAPEQ